MVIAVSLMVMFEGDQAKKESLLVQELKPNKSGLFRVSRAILLRWSLFGCPVSAAKEF